MVPTKDETRVNDSIKSLNGQIYWLPWGNRSETLVTVLKYLVKNGYWNCSFQKNYDGIGFFVYSSMPKFRFPLIFFHHDSKKQGGKGLIYYKYEIDKVVVGKNRSIQIKINDIKYEPIKEYSKVWFGITRVCPLEREGIDFGTFEIHPEITKKEKRKIDKYKDAAFLYYQVLPVIEPYHNENDKTCNCLICR